MIILSDRLTTVAHKNYGLSTIRNTGEDIESEYRISTQASNKSI